MPVQNQTDIAIIGAGPAGLTAAICLATRGISCHLIDKANFPRPKICGDGLGGKVLSVLGRTGTHLATELTGSGFVSPSQAVRFYSPSLHQVELGFRPDKPGQPAGLICKRADFDGFLLEKACKYSHVSFSGGIKAQRIFRAGDKLVIQDGSGRTIIESRLVLMAAGSENTLSRQLIPASVGRKSTGIGIRGYFENVSGCDGRNAIELHFLKELLPWYLWIFPFSGGFVNAGLALPVSSLKENRTSLRKLFSSLIEKYPHLRERFRDARLQGKMEAARIPVFEGKKQISGDNCMLLGDAASLVDPFTGEGIGNAMASGEYASETAARCLEKGDFSFESTRQYQEMINRNIIPELQSGLKLHRLARNKALLDLVIRKAAGNQAVRDKIAGMIYDTEAKRNLEKISFYIKLLTGW